MRPARKRCVRPAIEGLEGRQLLSSTSAGHALHHAAAQTTHAVPLTGTESGSYTVRLERESPLRERFHFQGKGTIAGLGAVSVTGDVTVNENLSQAGTATGILKLTFADGKGTARATVSETIPAHTGSIGALPFNYAFSGGTGLFRQGFDSGTAIFARTSTTPAGRGAKGAFNVQVVSNNSAAPQAGALEAASTGVVNQGVLNDAPAPGGVQKSAPLSTLTVTSPVTLTAPRPAIMPFPWK